MRFLFLALALPLMAELHTLRVEFEPSGCTACIESLEGRLKRMRGVDEVKVDGEDAIEMKLAAGNRVRLEIVRDFVEQGGGKVRRMSVEATGKVVDGQFELSGVGAKYPLDGAGKDGRVKAVLNDARKLIWKIVD